MRTTKLPVLFGVMALLALCLGFSTEARAERWRGGYRGGYVRHYAPVARAYRWHEGYRRPVYPGPIYGAPIYAPPMYRY